MNVVPNPSDWQPPQQVSREETIARSDAVLAKPDLPLEQTEDIFRIHALGLDWDMGVTRLRARRSGADRARRRRQQDRHLPPARRLRRLQVDGADGEAVRRQVRLQGRGDDISRPALSRRSVARLAGRHDQRRRHRAHADLAQGRAHHARPVRGGARHLDAHALRHPHGGAREARHDLLRPHGGMAGGVRGRHEGRHAPASSRPANSRSTSPAIRPAGRWCS